MESNSLFIQVFARRRAVICIAVLLLLFLTAFLAPFIAPYLTSDQDLKKTYHPPTALVLKDWQIQARIYRLKDPSIAAYEPDGDKTTPLHFFTSGSEYLFCGLITTKLHLFGVDPSERIYLLGSDATGRDVFSRLVYGSRVSMTIGILGVSITLVLGLLIGGFAGFYGGWVDEICMRSSEVIMAVPTLYMLLALRAAIHKFVSPETMFYFIIIILSFVGWPTTARVVRGMTLTIRELTYVRAAEAMGQTPLIIIIKHILPNIFSYLIVSSMQNIPLYILGEASLSFLNIGLQEPASSWGLMLSQAQDMKVFMLNFWWLLTPGFLIFLTVILYNILGDELRDIVDPKQRVISR